MKLKTTGRSKNIMKATVAYIHRENKYILYFLSVTVRGASDKGNQRAGDTLCSICRFYVLNVWQNNHHFETKFITACDT